MANRRRSGTNRINVFDQRVAGTEAFAERRPGESFLSFARLYVPPWFVSLRIFSIQQAHRLPNETKATPSSTIGNSTTSR